MNRNKLFIFMVLFSNSILYLVKEMLEKLVSKIASFVKSENLKGCEVKVFIILYKIKQINEGGKQSNR